jgi:hypothetical protein
MRLIDADKLIEDLKSSRFFIASLRCNKSILGETMRQYAKLINKTIEEQPTAFDVDKVVKQLERKSKIHNIVGESKNDIVNIYASACYDEAIEIVKAGGIDE